MNQDKTKFDNLIEKVKINSNGNCTFLFHNVGKKNNEKQSKEEVISSILSTGIKKQRGSILSTCTLQSNSKPLSEAVENYNIYQNGDEIITMILAIPEQFQVDGKSVYLGEVEKKYEGQCASNQYVTSGIIDYIYKNYSEIPPEFILGYVTRNCNVEKGSEEDERFDFHPNPNYLLANNESREKIANQISENKIAKVMCGLTPVDEVFITACKQYNLCGESAALNNRLQQLEQSLTSSSDGMKRN